ncbi:MAG: class I SAM-dependent methyltransferase [Actinomycetota bacterium]|nr:class I SAM-dependent methyltransferase [Actinomycetota bacterium]
MIILNLGSGPRTSPHCVNIDWSPYLRLKRNPLASRVAPLFLTGKRRERFLALDRNVLVHDLRQALPMPDGSADAVYHSHVLEHFDRQLVPAFLAEIRRVLKPGGVHRVVVPDLEASCRRYLDHVDRCMDHPEAMGDHDDHVAALIEQMVRREATGSSAQPPFRRRFENWLFGDARRRGETHQWMYDSINLTTTLEAAGFREIVKVDYRSSAIPIWDEIQLDRTQDGVEYIPGSLYMEGRA